MKYEVSERIFTQADRAQVMLGLEQQFRKVSQGVTREGDTLVVKSIEASFGSINRSDTTTVEVRPTQDGYLLVGSVNYRPSVAFWIILVLTLFTYVLWLIPIVFYLTQRKTVENGVQSVFTRVKNEYMGSATAPYGLAGTPLQTALHPADAAENYLAVITASGAAVIYAGGALSITGQGPVAYDHVRLLDSSDALAWTSEEMRKWFYSPELGAHFGVSPPAAPDRTAQVSAEPEPVVPSRPPGWSADPTGRHELRYWDGVQWTGSVSNFGTQSRECASCGTVNSGTATFCSLCQERF